MDIDSLFSNKSKRKEIIFTNTREAKEYRGSLTAEDLLEQQRRMRIPEDGEGMLRSFADDTDPAVSEYSHEKLKERLSLNREKKILVTKNYETHRPKEGIFVDMDRAYTRVEWDDSSYMGNVKNGVAAFLQGKEILSAIKDSRSGADREQIRWAYESTMNSLFALQKACQRYASQYGFRLFFTRGGKRKKQVGQVLKKATEELDALKAEYVSFMEKNYKTLSGMKKRYSVEDRDPMEIKISEYNEVVFDEDDLMDATDKSVLFEKNYLSMRSELDLKDTEMFNKSQKRLLMEINDYARNNTLSTIYRYRKNKDVGKTDVHDALSREEKQMKKLLSSLKDVMEDPGVPEKVKRRFRLYREYFTGLQSGGLTIEEGAKVIDMTGAELQDNYVKLRSSTREKVMSSRKVTSVNKKEAPLFSHEPCIADVNQEGMGNCYFVSSVARIVSVDKNLIKNMMKDEGDAVTVRFYHQTEEGTYEPEYIRVSKEVYRKVGTGAMWFQLLGKAYAVFMAKHYEKGYPITDIMEKSWKNTRKILGRYNGEKVPENVIEFGLVGSGGDNVFVLNSFLGGSRRQHHQIRKNPTYSVRSEIFLKAHYEYAVPKEKREEMYRTGKIYDEEYACYTETNSGLGSTIIYFRDLYRDKMSASEGDMETILEHYPKVQKRYEEAEKKYPSLSEKLPAMIGLVDRHFEDHEGVQYMGNWLGIYYGGLLGVDEGDRQVFAEFSKELENLYRTDFSDPAYWEKQNAPGEYASLFREVGFQDFQNALIKYAMESRFRLLSYGKSPEEKSEKSHEELLKGAREAVPYYTSRAVEILESACMKKHPNMWKNEKAVHQGILEIYDEASKISMDEFVSLHKSSGKTLQALASLLGLAIEDAYDFVQKALKKIHEKYMKEYDVHKEDDHFSIFTGVYSEYAESLFRDIQRGAKTLTHLTAGSFETNQEDFREVADKAGLQGRHAYTLLGGRDLIFKGKRLHMVKLRNPNKAASLRYKQNLVEKRMNHDEGHEDTFYMELNHFIKAFGTLG